MMLIVLFTCHPDAIYESTPPSFSRPRVSDDNAFSEALFRTLKYRPSFPQRAFTSRQDAHAWVEAWMGHRVPAADKLALLGRLTDLTADEATRTRLCALARDRLPEDARLQAICG